MTDHRPAARSAIRGLIQLLTDHQPHRQPRDFIGEAMQFPYRETSPRGDCPDWLAVALGAMAVVFMGFVVVHGFWSMSR